MYKFIFIIKIHNEIKQTICVVKCVKVYWGVGDNVRGVTRQRRQINEVMIFSTF